MDLVIRAATESDLASLNDLYNEYVVTAHYTFDVEPMPISVRREWFSHYAAAGRRRVLVALRDGALVGYTASSRYRPKAAYEASVETSVYLAPDATGAGIGTRLYQALFTEQGRKFGRYWDVTCFEKAIVSPPSRASPGVRRAHRAQGCRSPRSRSRRPRR
jgi:L-amino acid N-acyltransferase YncA